MRTVHQSTRTKCMHNQVKRPSKQERKRESKERKIRLVYHIRELNKEGKKIRTEIKEKINKLDSRFRGRNVKITRKRSEGSGNSSWANVYRFCDVTGLHFQSGSSAVSMHHSGACAKHIYVLSFCFKYSLVFLIHEENH